MERLSNYSKSVILHEVTGYPSCCIRVYPDQHAVTIRWGNSGYARRVNLPTGADMDEWIEQYANGQECTTEIIHRVRWEIQTLFDGDVWENVWWEDDKPEYFTTRAEAKKALDEFLKTADEEYRNGNFDQPYNRRDYRIVRKGS